jgi:hypothetical protein
VASCADDILSALEDSYPRSIDIFRLKEKPDVSLEEAVLRYKVRFKGEAKKSRKALPDIFPRKRSKVRNESIENPSKRSATADLALSPEEKTVLDALPAGDFTVDELSIPSMPVGELCATLTMLEIYGLIRSLPGGRYRRLR